MLRSRYHPTDDLDVEEIGTFESPDSETCRFVPAPPAAPRAPVPAPPLSVQDHLLLTRLGLELPMLWVWIFGSCLFAAPWPWLVWGVGLIALNAWLYPAYVRRGTRWVGAMYMATGLGQIGAALAQGLALRALTPLLGLYAGGLLISWIVLELRHQLRMADEPPPTEEDRIYYIYS